MTKDPYEEQIITSQDETNTLPMEAGREPPSALNPRRPPARAYPGIAQAIGLLLLLLILQVLLSIPIILAGLYHHPSVLTIPVLISTAIVVALGFKKTRAALHEVFPFGAVPLSTFLALLLTVIGLFILFSEIAGLLIRLLPLPAQFSQFMGDMVGGRQSYWESFVVVVIVAPFTEEILFRGLILYGFLKRYGANQAIGVSAFLFALLHGNPWQFVPGSCLGVLLAWCFVRTRSLVPCIFAHMFNNSIAFIILASQIKLPGPASSTVKMSASQHLWLNFLGLFIAAWGIYLLTRSLKKTVRTNSTKTLTSFN